MTKTQIFLQNFCHGQICCPKTLESRKKPAENKQTAKAVCYLSRYSYSTVYCHSTTVIYKTRVKSSNCKLTTLAYHRRILFTDFFSQSQESYLQTFSHSLLAYHRRILFTDFFSQSLVLLWSSS